MKSYLCAIGTANPEHKIPQMQIAGFMAAALQFDTADTRKLQALYRVSGIDSRHTVLPDYGLETGNFNFFPNNTALEPFPMVSQRLQIYRREALPLSVKAAHACFAKLPEANPQEITHLITVSCTGMYAPGLDIELLEALHLAGTVQRTAVNFMGCYAAFNALKLADTICKAQPEANVLIVCTELCTLHFQKSPETDHLISNALFGDGSAAMWVSGKPRGAVNLALENFHCDLIPAGKNDMAWQIGDFGFEMTLSSYVPELLKTGLKPFLQTLLHKQNMRPEEIDWFAMHPGGRRILEAIEKELGLTKEDNRFAYRVLKEFGNMSSVTVVFVLQEILAELRAGNHGEHVLSVAFGPGLTMEAMLLKVHYA